MNVDATVKLSKRKLNIGVSAEKEEGEPDFFDSIFGASKIAGLLEDEEDADIVDDID